MSMPSTIIKQNLITEIGKIIPIKSENTVQAFNSACISVYFSYKMLIKTIDTTMLAAQLLQTQIGKVVNSTTLANLKAINNSVNTLLKSVSTIDVPKSVSKKALALQNVMGASCKNFASLLRTDAIVMMENVKNSVANTLSIDNTKPDWIQDQEKPLDELISEAASAKPSTMDLLKYGNKQVTDFTKEIMRLKDNAIKDTFGLEGCADLFGLVSQYEKLIKTIGIPGMIKRLQLFEDCMINKGMCNRPKSDFMIEYTKNGKKQKKLRSIYYMEMFNIDINGKLKLNSFINPQAEKPKLNNINKLFTKVEKIRKMI